MGEWLCEQAEKINLIKLGPNQPCKGFIPDDFLFGKHSSSPADGKTHANFVGSTKCILPIHEHVFGSLGEIVC